MPGWWISDAWSGTHGQVVVVSWLLWVIVSITLHELGHGWAAIRHGDDTPIRTGHMTWNPVVHMGLYSFAALILIGIAWGAMPVDPSRMRGKHAESKVLFAGPLVNLALFLVLSVLSALWMPIATGAGVEDPLLTNLSLFLYFGAMLNAVLFLFNLVPIPPLDGGRILALHSRSFREMTHSENGQWALLGAFVLLFVFGADMLFFVGAESVDAITRVIRAIVP